MASVYNVRRKAHIDSPALNLTDFSLHNLQILGIVDFRTKLISNIQRPDAHCRRHLVEGFFRITVPVAVLTEFLDFAKPDCPVFLRELVQGLCLHCSIEEFNPDLLHLSVFDDRLEILFRQRQCGTYSHTTGFAFQNLFKDTVLENQIPVHQDYFLILDEILCTIDGVYVIGLVIVGVFYKCEADRQFQRIAIIDENFIEISGCHDNFHDIVFSQQPQLPRQNCLL